MFVIVLALDTTESHEFHVGFDLTPKALGIETSGKILLLVQSNEFLL